jgi:hypothetical protein
MSLAGLLEIADREFQAIQDADRDLNQKNNSLITAGQLNEVEITPDAVKAYLDRKLGPDGRMSDFSYDWAARILLQLGFRSLEQVDNCIKDYDGTQLSRIIYGLRQGQVNRLEYMLLAGMGQRFIERHPWNEYQWFRESRTKMLEIFVTNKIEVSNYDPLPSLSEDDETTL